MAVLVSLAFAPAPPADSPDLPPVASVQTAFDRLVRAATNTDWPSERIARTELASLGQEAVPKVSEAVRGATVTPACDAPADELLDEHVRERRTGGRYRRPVRFT